MKIDSQPLTNIDGVFANAVHCGIKQAGLDLSFIFVPSCSASAGVFTRNWFCSPTVQYTRKALAENTLRAVIVNSGNANAGTGSDGEQVVLQTAMKASKLLGIRSSEVGVASTGIIGRKLPVEKIELGLESLLKDPLAKQGDAAAHGILTTDTTAKQVFVTCEVGGKTIHIAGMTKGSGMIAPNMATMLAFLATDILIDQQMLQALFQDATNKSFNMISVDGETSTNDMSLIFATGKSGVSIETSEEIKVFAEALDAACQELAKMIVRDGEGATKMLEAVVTGACSPEAAQAVALQIINSPLVKTALHGADPNWGRVLAAAGKNPAISINPSRVKLSFAGTTVFEHGLPCDFDRAALVEQLKNNLVQLQLDLGEGSSQATAWGCDLSKRYVDINVAYN